jgi:hypothetical protein
MMTQNPIEAAVTDAYPSDANVEAVGRFLRLGELELARDGLFRLAWAAGAGKDSNWGAFFQRCRREILGMARWFPKIERELYLHFTRAQKRKGKNRINRRR